MKQRVYLDLSYGPHDQNVLDIYVAGSATPAPLYVYIHGGGFRGGDKTDLHPVLLASCLEAGISVAAVNYRLSGVAPYPAAMLDSARAIQYLRYRAEQFNLDPTRFSAGGGSAGAGITLWIGFHPDLADTGSTDPVERQSTHLACIAAWEAQSSYDPNYIRTIISGSTYAIPALQEFFRVTPDAYETPQARRMFEEASALNHVSESAPPVFLFYVTSNVPMTPNLDPHDGIHHPRFGQLLKEKMDALGLECELFLREECPELSKIEARVYFLRRQVAFLKRHLKPSG